MDVFSIVVFTSNLNQFPHPCINNWMSELCSSLLLQVFCFFLWGVFIIEVKPHQTTAQLQLSRSLPISLGGRESISHLFSASFLDNFSWVLNFLCFWMWLCFCFVPKGGELRAGCKSRRGVIIWISVGVVVVFLFVLGLNACIWWTKWSSRRRS